MSDWAVDTRPGIGPATTAAAPVSALAMPLVTPESAVVTVVAAPMMGASVPTRSIVLLGP